MQWSLTERILFCFCSELVNTNVTNGKTGNLILNRKGDRINAVYKIVNLKNASTDAQLTVVGSFDNDEVSFNDTIIWPGGQDEKPEGIFVSTHLKVKWYRVCSHLTCIAVVPHENHTMYGVGLCSQVRTAIWARFL